VSLHCGKCGYDVRGLPSDICPECGSNLDVVGRVQHRTLKQRRVRRAVWFAILMPLLGVIAMPWLECTVAPGIVEERATVMLSQPKSRAYRQIIIQFYSSNWYFPGVHTMNTPWQSGEVRIENGSRHSVSVDLTDKTIRTNGGARKLACTSSLLRWFAESGVDTSAPGVDKEAQVIEELISKANAPDGPFAKRGQYVHVTGGTRTYYEQRRFSPALLVSAGIDTSVFQDAEAIYDHRLNVVPKVHGFLLLVGVGIWAGGIWWILRSPRGSQAPSPSGELRNSTQAELPARPEPSPAKEAPTQADEDGMDG
jgi:hypothetical protein